jgi:beta-glucosidase
VAIIYLRTYETEERDRVSLKLPRNGDRLVQAISAVNPNTVVVVGSGGPVTMPWRNRVGGVMESWFGGQEEGNALTAILFGDEAPSGHLPVTFPASERRTGPGQENPWATYNDLDVEFYEEVNIGYRGYIAENLEPAFPGHRGRAGLRRAAALRGGAGAQARRLRQGRARRGRARERPDRRRARAAVVLG